MKNIYLDYNPFTKEYILYEGKSFNQRKESFRFRAEDCSKLLTILRSSLDPRRKSELAIYGEFDVDCAERLKKYFTSKTKTFVNLDNLED